MHREVGVKKGFINVAEIRVKHMQGSETRQVKQRGDPETETARTQIKVEVRKSE